MVYGQRQVSRDSSLSRCRLNGTPLNDTTQPVDIEEGDRSPTMNRQWLEKIAHYPLVGTSIIFTVRIQNQAREFE